MPTWAWILIAVAAALAGAAIVWLLLVRQRTARLRDRFGAEYDRTVRRSGGRRDAEAELAARAERRERLDVRPLAPASRERYRESWQAIQARFVDDPTGAVADADGLIGQAMAEQGYPMTDFEQRAADVSVDHPKVVEHYRAGHQLLEDTSAGTGGTEELRRAMQHYRVLFEDILGEPAVEPARDDAVMRR